MTNQISPPVGINTLELSTTLSYHGAWLSFLVQPVVPALSRNLKPERGVGVGSVLLWHVTVTELYLEFVVIL